MANRLRDERRRLDEMTAGDLAVRASFEVSFASLPARTRGVAPADAFRLLGLWQGPTVSTAAAAALFGASEDDAADALELLVDVHLLESKGPDRYKFHDLLRVYASERATADLSEKDRQSAIARLLGWYVRTADAVGAAVSSHRYDIPLRQTPDDSPALSFESSTEALAWYDDERFNVVAATGQAASVGLHDLAWRIPVPLFWSFLTRDNWADCVATHRIALDSTRTAADRQAEAWVLNNLGYALGATGNAEGVGLLEQSAEIRREIGDRLGEGQSATNLADLYPRFGRGEEALGMLRRALELNREAGNPHGEGVALVDLGDALLELDRPEEALHWLQQAYDIFTEIRYADGIGYAQHCLGRCYLALVRHKEAVDSFQEALTSHQRSGNRHLQAVTLNYLGRAQAESGLTVQARESWARSAAIYDELGDVTQAALVRAENDGISPDVE
jgi:tetratricopeptide (TPR) repeat protein